MGIKDILLIVDAVALLIALAVLTLFFMMYRSLSKESKEQLFHYENLARRYQTLQAKHDQLAAACADEVYFDKQTLTFVKKEKNDKKDAPTQTMAEEKASSIIDLPLQKKPAKVKMIPIEEYVPIGKTQEKRKRQIKKRQLNRRRKSQAHQKKAQEVIKRRKTRNVRTHRSN
nr:MAG TPA: cell division protein [Caudoviricetes sp.]